MRNFSPVVGILACIVNHIGDEVSMCDPIASELVRHDLFWLKAMCLQQSLEKMPCCIPVSARLQKHINHFTALVDRTPQIVLLAPNLHEDFINEKSVAVALVLSPVSPGIPGAKLDAPKTNRLMADGDPSLGQ
jgi:hypothetical protein